MTMPTTSDGAERAMLIAVGRSTGVLAVLVVLYAVLPLQGPRWWLGSLIGAAAVVALVPFTVRRARAVSHSPRPVADAVEALIVLVGMLVLGFSALYLAIDRDGSEFTGLVTRIDAVYFTVTTLSTVGYGDIVATGQTARLVVVIQIVADIAVLSLAVRLLTAAARRGLATSSESD